MSPRLCRPAISPIRAHRFDISLSGKSRKARRSAAVGVHGRCSPPVALIGEPFCGCRTCARKAHADAITTRLIWFAQPGVRSDGIEDRHDAATRKRAISAAKYLDEVATNGARELRPGSPNAPGASRACEPPEVGAPSRRERHTISRTSVFTKSDLPRQIFQACACERRSGVVAATIIMTQWRCTRLQIGRNHRAVPMNRRERTAEANSPDDLYFLQRPTVLCEASCARMCKFCAMSWVAQARG